MRKSRREKGRTAPDGFRLFCPKETRALTQLLSCRVRRTADGGGSNMGEFGLDEGDLSGSFITVDQIAELRSIERARARRHLPGFRGVIQQIIATALLSAYVFRDD